jgi:transcription elongation factor GreA
VVSLQELHGRNCTKLLNFRPVSAAASCRGGSCGGFCFLPQDSHGTIPLTTRGAEKLKEELHRLKTVERHAVIQAIAEARAQGDLSENAEYDAAKDKQGFIEGRILESRASSPTHRSSTRRSWMPTAAWCSARPSTSRTRTAAKVTYQIVGDDEADLKLGLISISDRPRLIKGAG